MNRIPHWEKINGINLAHPVSVSRWENRISDYWSTLPPFIDVFFIYEGSSLGRMTRQICLCLFYQGGGGGGRIVGLLEEAFDRTDFLLPELYGIWRSWSEGWKWRILSIVIHDMEMLCWRRMKFPSVPRSHQKVVQIPMCNSSLQFLWNWPIRKMARRHPPFPETKNDFFFPFWLHRA